VCVCAGMCNKGILQIYIIPLASSVLAIDLFAT